MLTAKFRTRPFLTLAVLGTLLATSACSSGNTTSEAGPAEVQLAGFNIFEPTAMSIGGAYQDEDRPDLTIDYNFGPSGTLSRAIAAGDESADMVVMNRLPEVETLVDAGVVAPTWDDGPAKGIYTTSTVVFVVPKGNPKNLHTWEDLTRPGVRIVNSDPGSAGNARWVLAAAYGQAELAGAEPGAGAEYMQRYLGNVSSWNISGGAATRAFLAGQGDVLVTFESEAIDRRNRGAEFDYVVPDTTILVEYPAAVTVDAPESANQLMAFGSGPEGQELLAAAGYRSVDPNYDVQGAVPGANDPANPFPPVRTFRVADIGGWKAVDDALFNANTGLVQTIRAQA